MGIRHRQWDQTLWFIVGGWATPLKIMKVNGKDYPFFIMENKIHVPNHQPVYHLVN